MNRRHFLAAGAAAMVSKAAAPAHSLILIDEADAARMRTAMTPERTALFARLAQEALASGPWSIASHRPTGLPVNAGPNDYVSEGPYWWPDPKNPAAPYIRKDGQRNPDRFQANRNDLGAICSATLALGLGAWFLKNSACAPRANKVLEVWFLDPKTRMTPHLEHGQLTRGHDDGRGTGLIDTVSYIHLVQGIALLELAGGLDGSVAQGVREWFTAFARWMTTSKKGLAEKTSGNNHATWWTAQVASYSAFTGDAANLAMCWNHCRKYLVPTEIKPDGSCPREEERTNSLSYSSMNLDAFAVLSRVAQMNGVDLWKPVAKSYHYLLPYMLQPSTWKKEQISKYSASGYVFPGLAGLGLGSPELLAGYAKLPHAESAFVQFCDLLSRPA
ncbi:MAG TPA: alginate lyase family protein [Candidatus Sulfopaludibacter sp.]|jgi:hypothetical protein|nr:alginate lyase family protein [Candidatus Sulfopaludibacter sp.]